MVETHIDKMKTAGHKTRKHVLACNWSLLSTEPRDQNDGLQSHTHTHLDLRNSTVGPSIATLKYWKAF